MIIRLKRVINKIINKSKKGFTLAEVMVSAAIILVTFAMFLSLMQSLDIFGRTSAQSVALNVARERMTRELNSSDFVPTPTPIIESGVVIQKHRLDISTSRDYVQIVNNKEVVRASGLQRITILIIWHDKRGQNREIKLVDYYGSNGNVRG